MDPHRYRIPISHVCPLESVKMIENGKEFRTWFASRGRICRKSDALLVDLFVDFEGRLWLVHGYGARAASCPVAQMGFP